MREIKFRFWDGTSMLDSTYIDSCIGLKDVLDGITKIIVMQYTGLKDKNGKEIYEGDIVCTYNHKECSDLPINMKYGDGEPFAENTYHEQVRWNQNDAWWDGLGRDHGELNYPTDRCEVIGNIYSNPELLT